MKNHVKMTATKEQNEDPVSDFNKTEINQLPDKLNMNAY